MTLESGDDIFEAGPAKFSLTVQNTSPADKKIVAIEWKTSVRVGTIMPERMLGAVPAASQAEADAKTLGASETWGILLTSATPGESADVSFSVNIPTREYLFIAIENTAVRSARITTGATLVHTKASNPRYAAYTFDIWRISNGSSSSPPPPVDVIPPPPVLDICEFPVLSLNFIAVMSDLAKWIMCVLRNILAQLVWIVSAIAAVIPQLLKFLIYILSLQWLEDWIKRFFDELDIWVSEKFGIDPALPFWEELVKKAIVWLGGGIDEAAAKAIERLK